MSERTTLVSNESADDVTPSERRGKPVLAPTSQPPVNALNAIRGYLSCVEMIRLATAVGTPTASPRSSNTATSISPSIVMYATAVRSVIGSYATESPPPPNRGVHSGSAASDSSAGPTADDPSGIDG